MSLERSGSTCLDTKKSFQKITSEKNKASFLVMFHDQNFEIIFHLVCLDVVSGSQIAPLRCCHSKVYKQIWYIQVEYN